MVRSSLPWGLLIRRARIDRGLSQGALAHLAGISQAIVSYYERGRVTPPPDTVARLERVLDLKSGELRRALAGAGDASVRPTAAPVEPARSAFLGTIGAVGWRSETFDLPAGDDGGDLAFAVDLRSHAFLVVIDAEGSGPAAVPVARLAAACAFGAIVSPGGGVPAVEDVVEPTVRLWPFVGLSTQSASICVVSFERRSRRLRQCRLGLPPPFLRSGRLAQWTGKPEGPAGAFTGEYKLDEDALLVVATDGAAHLPTKGSGPLWNSPELRTLLAHATDPGEIVDMLAQRAVEPAAGERVDDRLAVAVML